MKLLWIAITVAALLNTSHGQTLSAEALARKNGCFECHTREKPHIGPSFNDIAARYNDSAQTYDLKLLSVSSAEDLPTERKNQVIVARAGKELHVRIFDPDGEMIVDKGGTRLLEGAELGGLQKRLDAVRLSDAPAFTRDEKSTLIASAVKAAGYTAAQSREALIEIIKNGGKGKWKAAKGAVMPPYWGRLSRAEMVRLLDWVLRPLSAVDLRVMKTGLGSGTVTSSPAGISCGADCDQTYTSAETVTLTATPDAGSVFSRWEGDASGAGGSVTVTMSASRSVRAVFDRAVTPPPLADFRPEGIRDYLSANPSVISPALFISSLPEEYRRNWILMTRSESLQTGTAESPRVLLPSANAQFVFTVGMIPHTSYPGSHPKAVEYMQWDAAEKNFRFHEIVLENIPVIGSVPARLRGVSFDDNKCSKCHSTRNVLNRSSWPGTSGVTPGTVKVKNKPNWDTYDSWGGMLSFNRDRIYQGSVEAAAFRKILNLWTWQSNPPVRAIIEQLELQPPGVPSAHIITRTSGGPNDGHINFAFDSSPPVLTEPVPTGSAGSISTNYSFNGAAGTGTATSVVRQGNFITLHHSNIPGSDEGRGVRFFDALGGLAGDLNPRRIADELINHRYATGSVSIDVRPVTLAIARGLIQVNAAANQPVGSPPRMLNLPFFNARHGGMAINALVADTRARAQSLPRRKADIQKINLDRTGDVYRNPLTTPVNGLIAQYGAATAAGLDISLSRLRQEVFRRSIDNPSPDSTVMGGIYVDRERYSENTEPLALYRYFLEPLGVSVDKWSMGVRGRSRTYTFADVFGVYTNLLTSELEASLLSEPFPGLTDPDNDTQLMDAVQSSLSALPGAGDVPKYTDIQRIFNKSCIECHGGLSYPPYVNYGTYLDFSENESPPAGQERLRNSHNIASSLVTAVPATSYLFQRITETSEACPDGLMPCGGPPLPQTDIDTIRRWIVGGAPFTVGDPHIRTVDGTGYDFQAAGEFVLLRDEGLELQARHTAVNTERPLGPNAHTGLTSCVSINTAVALRIGNQRITFQPNLNGKADPEGLQLRVNGELKQPGARGIPLAGGGRIISTVAPGGLQIQAPGGTVIVITPGWWAHYEVWFLNIDTRNVRATDGLMGSIAPGNWLPALPDGTFTGPRPDDLEERHEVLYKKFGNAWRVTDANSLFDYAAGTSTKTFTIEDWPGKESPGECKVPAAVGIAGKPPLKPMTKEEATKLAAEVQDPAHKAHLIEDLMTTGDPVFVRTYLFADRIMHHKPPAVPVLRFPENNLKGLDKSVAFRWDAPKQAGDARVSYKVYVWGADEAPNINNAVPVADATAAKADALPVKFEAGKAYFWKVIAEDSMGAVTESQTRRFEMK